MTVQTTEVNSAADPTITSRGRATGSLVIDTSHSVGGKPSVASLPAPGTSAVAASATPTPSTSGGGGGLNDGDGTILDSANSGARHQSSSFLGLMVGLLAGIVWF